MFVHTGDYVEHKRDDVFHSTYYTFTPLPLMKGSFFTMDDDLASLLAETYLALGVLEGMSSLVSDRITLAELMLFRENCFSMMIDYADNDIYSILINHACGIADSDQQNIQSAYRYAKEVSAKRIDFNSIISHALPEDYSKQKTMIRSKPLFLTPATSNYRQYNPTAPGNIWKALIDISQYILSDNTDILIKTAMCHYQFEMIHPYERFNGIVGRILPYYIMSNKKLNGVDFLCISASLYNHKDEYFYKLGSTQKTGVYTIWIDFFLRCIHEAAVNAADFIRYYDSLTCDDERVLARCQIRRDHTLDVCRYFRRNVVSSISQAGEKLNLSYGTVSKSVVALQDFGILTQISQGSRNRLFAHDGILKRLTSPG